MVYEKFSFRELRAECREKGENIYEIMNRWVEEIPTEEFCPIYLPFLMASNVHPNASGSFVGISNYHTRKHLLRSVYEGVIFSHRYHLEKLLKTRKCVPKSIRLAGGAARSPMWTQMFADVMNLPVESVEVNETGAFGCALIGAVASGAYGSVAEASEKMCRISEPVLPDPKRAAVYDEKYKLYCRTIEALDSVWDFLQEYRDQH